MTVSDKHDIAGFLTVHVWTLNGVYLLNKLVKSVGDLAWPSFTLSAANCEANIYDSFTYSPSSQPSIHMFHGRCSSRP